MKIVKKMFRKIKVRGDKIFSIVSLFAMLANSFAPVLAAIPTYTYAEGIAAPVEVLTKEDKEEIKVEEKIESESVLKEEKNNETKNETESQSSEEVSEENQEGDILEDGVSDYRPEVEITEDEVKEVEEVSILKETVNSVNELNDSEEVTEASASEEGPVLENKEKEYKYLEDGAVVDSTREDWDVDGKVAETKKVVKIGVKYIFPLDEGVSVTFTKLPKSEEDRARLKIERVRVEELNLPDEFKTDAEYAFDITTEGMENGEFEYDLTLPKPKDVEAKVISIEEDGDIIKVDKDDIDQKEKVVEVKDQSHFSIKVPVYSLGKWTWVDKPEILVKDTLGTSYIKWDKGSEKHSGLEFIGKQTFDVDIDGEEEFELGTLKHHNFPVNKAIEQAKLAVTINLGAPISQTKVFNMDLTIEETLNSYPCPSWHTTGNPACDDRITFPTVYSKEFFEIGDTKYVLEITGFIKGGQNVTSFITKERTTNEAIIRGRLRSIPAKVTICDRTNSDQNPYVVHTPSVDGIWTEGHDGHNGPIWYPGLKELGVKWGDIIPEFRYFDSNGDVQVYGGKNNGEYGLSILENGCVFPEGKITVNKEIIAPAGVSESFDITGTGTHSVVGFPSAFNGFKGTNKGTISPTTPATFNVYPGKYTFNETAKEGWIETGNTCNDVVVENGDNKTCTIKNTKASTLTIVKHAEQVSDTSFNFTATGNGLSNFSLIDNSPDTDPKKVFTGLLPGEYSVTEDNLSSGWTLKSAICDNGRNPNALELTAGSNVTCTFTNTQQGSLTIVKKALPFGTDSFGFTLTGKGVDEQFNLVDNSDTEDASETFSLKAGTYAVVEDNYSDWKTTYSCTGNNTIDNIVLEAGKSVTCTFTNTKYGSISGRKLHDLDGLASTTNDRKPVQGYTIFIDTNKDGKLDPGEKSTTTAIDGSYSFTGLEPGEYTVVEVMKLGWIVLPGTSTSWTIKLSPGENRKGVDFINIEKPTIEVIKFVDIDGDGKVDVEYATDWTWKLDDKEYKMFGKEDKPMEILPGTYTISEIQKDGYHVKSMMCDNGGVKFFEEPTESTKLTINSGDKILCRFTNTRDTGTLIVRKEVINDNGGKRKAGEFSFKIGTSKGVGFDQDPTNPLLGENRFEKYPTGTYSIIEPEANTRGYATTYDNCDKIVVEKGKEAVCTITNDDVAPTLTVIKKVVNDNGGTATADDFNIRLNDKELKFELDPKSEDKYTSTYISNPEVQSNIKYILEEIDHSGYKEGTWSCKPKKDDGVGDARPIPTKEQVVSEQADKVPSTSLTLSPGDDIVCTITNDDLAPKLTLVKEVNNKDLPEDLRKVKEDWTITATGPTTISGDGGVTSGADFKAGTYTLSETDNIPGFTSANGWSCKGATLQEGNKITLKVGDVASCKIINESTYGKVVVEKQTTPDGSNSLFEFNPSWSETHFSLSDGQQHDSGWLVPGQYSVSEIVPTGWELTDIVCNDNNSGSSAAAGNTANINLDANETVTCTFTNTQRPVTIVATKVVCDYEKDLPNYGYGAPVNITENTASDWIASHPSCRLEPDWSFQWGDDWDTNPSDSFVGEVAGWNTFGPTDIDGVATVKIKDFGTTSQIKVREVLKANYFPFTYLTNGSTNKDDVSAEIYCDVDVLNYDNDDRITPEYGNTYYCVAWNVEKNPALSIDKTAKQSTYNEVGDVINYSFVVTNTGNVSLNGPVTIDDDKTTDETCPAVNTVGNSDDKLDPGESITCTASYTITQTDLDTGSVTNVASASVGGTTSPTDTVKVDAVPTLSISKSNDSYPTAEKIGNQVKFTIEVTAHRNDVSEVEVYDLFSKGFKYIEGSWTAFSSSRGDIVVPEPTYASPAVWDLGYMEKDETITLTYLAEITDSVTAGIYKDLAWTQGSSELSADGILGYAEETGYVNDSFVGTKVLVEVDPSELKDKVSVKEKKIEGEVLGAATLPATGSRTLWVNIVLALSAVGGTLMILGSLLDKNSNKKGSKKGVKKSLIGLLVLSLFIALSRGVYAAPTVVRISEPTTPAKDEFNLVFVVMDIQNREIAAKCFYKFEDSSYSQFGSDITIPSGKSGDSRTCFVDKNVLDSDGKYIFKVEATVEGTTVSSEEVSVDYDSDGPGKPEYIKKEKVNDCVNKITLKTSDDGETKYVKVYADDGKEIHIKDSNLIETEDLGPGKKFSFEHIVSGDACKKDWYYAVVAFDSAGNASNPRSETVTKVIETAPGTEEEVVEAIPVVGGAGIAEEGGAVAGDQEVAKAEGEGQGATEEGGSAIEGNEEEGSVLGEKTEKKSVFRSPWLWLVLVGLGIIIVSGVKKGKKN